MQIAEIPFPNIDPVLVTIGPLAIHWYGIGYIVGILFGWWYAKRLVTSPKLWPAGVLPMKPEDIDDFVVWAAIGVVLGGRTGYVLFYDLPRYIANPLDIFAVWQGGMSFHGGLIGVITAMALFAHRRGRPFFEVADFTAPLIPLGLGAGRSGGDEHAHQREQRGRRGPAHRAHPRRSPRTSSWMRPLVATPLPWPGPSWPS